MKVPFRGIVLKGVTIGRQSVIVAGSVATKNVPENEIWVGNPVPKVGAVTACKNLEGYL